MKNIFVIFATLSYFFYGTLNADQPKNYVECRLHQSELQDNHVKIELISGLLINTYYEEMWDLCNKVYAEYPYLYTAEGKDYVYKYYLDSFEQSQNSSIVLVFDEQNLVGIATGICMNDYKAVHYKKPFSDKNYDLNTVYYIADLLLLPQYRNMGYEQKMYQALENEAKTNFQFNKICYLTIKEAERTINLKPDVYFLYEPFQPSFWEKLGFMVSGFGFETKFEIIGETDDTPHEMVYWIKNL